MIILHVPQVGSILFILRLTADAKSLVEQGRI